jgi:hypothetical protein
MSDPLEVTFAMKDWFLDRDMVAKKIGAARQKALLVSGAFIRRAARDLLRAGKKPAQDGRPPKVHSPEPNIKTILFALDPATDSMIVGPVKLNSRGVKNSNRETVPQLLEQGGTAEVIEYTPDGGKTWMPASDLARPKYRGKPVKSRRRQATYKPHPFMSVALEKALPKIPEHFRDLI